MRKILTEYRSRGNCFSTCIVNGCQLQNDQKLNGVKPELVIFDESTLKDSDETKEQSPALCYLISNNYDIKIIDPDPHNGIWGKCFKSELLSLPERNCNKYEIEQYTKEGWSVVFSTLGTNSIPHAILAYKNKLYDPENSNLWDNPFTLEEYWRKSLQESRGQYLIAFKKN